MGKKPDTAALCTELLKLAKKTEAEDARKREIKSELLKAAGEAGENLKIVIDRLGVVKVSAPKPKECTGTAPEIVVEAFLRLPPGDRKSLMAQGLVKEVEQWKGAYYGSVTPELF